MAKVYNASNGANAQEGRVKGSEIFVGGLPRGITERNILEVFSPYGEIVELRMIKDQNGASKGFCFVRFATKEAALRAHNERNGTMVKGKKIGVSLSSDKDSLFFGNLRKDWSSGEFDRLVRQAFTDVVSVDLASTPSLGASSEGRKRLNRGFAFVKFSSHAAAARAHRIGSKPEFLLAGGWHPLVDWVEEKEPKLDLEEMAKVKIAFVGNLPTNADEGLLRKLFEPFGKIEKVVLTRKGHLPFGFVHFENRSCLDNAIREMDGKTVQGPCNGPMSKIQVEVAKTDKEKKRVREEDRSKPFMPGSQTDPLGTSHTHDSLEPKSKAPKFASSVVDAADPYEEAVIALSSTIKERLLQIFRLGIATRFDVDVESITGLKDLPESAAIAVLDQFMISGAEQHDKRAYFNSLVAKHRVKKLGLKWSQPYVHPRNETGFETKESEAISLHAAPRIQATDWSSSGSYRASRELLSYTPSLLEDSYTRSSLGKPGDPISSYRTPPLSSSLDYGSDTRPASRITSSERPPYQARPLSLFDYGSDARPIPPISSSEHPLERPLERPQMKFDPFTGEPYKFDPFTGKPIRQESHPWRSTNANLI